MAIGLVVLGVLALFIFFGVTNKLFERAGIANWVAFLVALVLGLSVLVPDVRFGNNFSMSVSGFVVPLAITALLLIIAASSRRLLLSVYSIAIVAAAVTVIRLTVRPSTDVLAISGGIVTGIVAGILAYCVGRSYLATVAGAMGGILLGDALANGLYNAYSGQTAVRLGGMGIFDAIVIGSVFALIFAAAVDAIRRSAHRDTRIGRRAATTEAATDVTRDDMPVVHDSKENYMNHCKERNNNPGCDCNKSSPKQEPKYKDWFE